MNKILFFLGCAVIFSILYRLGAPENVSPAPTVLDGNVHIFFCDVGQGDGILITHQNYQIVIDGGPGTAILDCLKRYLPKGDTTLEALIATHSDSDHITGLAPVLANYQVQHIYTQAYGKSTKTWEKFRAAVATERSQGAHVTLPSIGETIIFDPIISAKIMNPSTKIGTPEVFSSTISETQLSALYAQEAKEYKSTNDEAIALILYIKQVSIAFTADIEKSVELALREKRVLQDVDVLKVAHHGSKSSSSMEFLNETTPEAVVISVGRKNSYKHPSPEVIEQFTQIGLSIFRTDQMGTIEMITDGEKYWWQEHPESISK